MSKTYPSDLTDEQWSVVEPLLPPSHGGRPPEVDFRNILNGIFYRNKAGCQWRMAGNARKRHLGVDTVGLLLVVLVTGAGVLDAVAACRLATSLNRTNYPRVKKIWADSKYHNHALYAHIKGNVDGTWELEVV